MILKGQRHAGKSIVEKMIRYFQFSDYESKYFRELVRIQKAAKGDQRLTVLMLEQSKTLSPVSNNAGGAEPERQLVFDWASYAIREMTQLVDFKADSEWISSRLGEKLTQKKIDQVLERLLNEGFVKKTDQTISTTDKIICPQAPVDLSQARAYHKEILELANDAINIPIDKRTFHVSTLNIKKARVKEAKELIRDFQVKFSELMEDSPGDEVYQFQMQLFPLTK
jgi:uncharacterized protein (TIGR02147 family)